MTKNMEPMNEAQVRRAELLDMTGAGQRARKRLQAAGHLPSDTELRLYEAELRLHAAPDEETEPVPESEAQFGEGQSQRKRPLTLPEKQHRFRAVALTLAADINRTFSVTLQESPTPAQRVAELERQAKDLRALMANAESQLKALGL